MKTLFSVIAIVLLIVVVIAAFILYSLNNIIEKGVETAGTASLGTDVKLDDADLHILKGRLSLAGMRIANPTGYKAENLFGFSKAQMTVKPTSLLQDEIVIDNIVLESPSLTIEQSMSGTNISVVLGNIKRTLPTAKKPNAEEPETDKTEKEKTFHIKLLRITGADVTFASSLAPQKPINVTLPDIQMENISNADGTGLTLAEVIEKVLRKMMQKGLVEGKGIVPVDILNDVSGDLGQLGSELAGSAVDTGKELLEKTTDSLRGLFKKD